MTWIYDVVLTQISLTTRLMSGTRLSIFLRPQMRWFSLVAITSLVVSAVGRSVETPEEPNCFTTITLPTLTLTLTAPTHTFVFPVEQDGNTESSSEETQSTTTTLPGSSPHADDDNPSATIAGWQASNITFITSIVTVLQNAKTTTLFINQPASSTPAASPSEFTMSTAASENYLPSDSSGSLSHSSPTSHPVEPSNAPLEGASPHLKKSGSLLVIGTALVTLCMIY